MSVEGIAYFSLKNICLNLKQFTFLHIFIYFRTMHSIPDSKLFQFFTSFILILDNYNKNILVYSIISIILNMGNICT